MKRFLLHSFFKSFFLLAAIGGNSAFALEQRFRLEIDKATALPGQEVELKVTNSAVSANSGVAKGQSVRSFSFWFDFDTTCLEFIGIKLGSIFTNQGWKTFLIKLPSEICIIHDSCYRQKSPIGIFASADSKTGQSTSLLTQQTQGEWLVLKCKVKNDPNLFGRFCPVNWLWSDCSDNTISNFTGNTVWLVDSLISADGIPVDLKTAFQNDLSACDTVLLHPNGVHPKRAITFVNGGITINTTDTKFRLVIGTVNGNQGVNVEVPIVNVADASDPEIPNGKSLGGFSLLLSYDCSCLQFLEARKGQLLINQKWEYFTWRFGALGGGNCGAGCPACLIRVVAIADFNNGNLHPNLTRENRGEWVVLKFRTSIDSRLAGLLCPINWYWLSCSDNILADSLGTTIWVADSLYSRDGYPINLATAFPIAVDQCDQIVPGPGKSFPKKKIIFQNGGIQLPSLPDPCFRGDLNLNGLANEFSDFTLFRNYFLYGDSVLSPDISARSIQICNSDVNGDGIPLHLGDLVFLGRIIAGDAVPLLPIVPKVVQFQIEEKGNRLIISSNSTQDIGGIYLKLNYSGTVRAPSLLDSAKTLDLDYQIDPAELRLVLSSTQKGARIPAGGYWPILSIPLHGDVESIELKAATYYGSDMLTTLPFSTYAKKPGSNLPLDFALSQNYPNPFNPTTSFVLSLPTASHYQVTIYNLLGEAIRSFEGEAPAGNKVLTWDGVDNEGNPVSSGIYFYKAEAGKFVDKKKMILMR